MNPLLGLPTSLAVSRCNRPVANPAALCAITAGAGGLTLGQAAIVQIDINQVYSTASPGMLDRDLTGDGLEDISTWNLRTYAGRTTSFFFSNYVNYSVIVLTGSPGGATAGFARYSTGSGSTLSSSFFAAVFDSVNSSVTYGSGVSPQSRTGFVEIRFSDARINHGAETGGFLQLRANNVSETEQQITVVRLVFDDASTNCPAADLAAEYPSFFRPQILGPDPRLEVLERELKQLKKKLRKALARARRAGVRGSKKPSSLFHRLKGVDTSLAREIKRLQRKIKRKEGQIASIHG